MSLLERFFAADEVSLKICGITRAEDARGLVACGVTALGVNFWPLSKRFISPDDAAPWLHEVNGSIVRVGVFVNAKNDFIEELVRQDLIDVVQLHGDESAVQMEALQARGIPCVRAYGVKCAADLVGLAEFANADALLLDTAAPGVYGGTGEVFDWSLVQQVREAFPGKPLFLAGGITPQNAESAVRQVLPAALDVASGAEISPGVKDFVKVHEIQAAVGKGILSFQ
ncbi:MAG: hypothetical protein B9S37_06370 [Verrucomicrobiia bacterium Tous-C3TDCM]|nr:MAG: hypothetical protein B9S37_06370 [Verrucomicrobiae bacterium Tous-C3TDCM]PAZ06300.1 MAG: hypothetical protein CAK88_05210 [Verrucomicrobiae bacterium AMD-G2]